MNPRNRTMTSGPPPQHAWYRQPILWLAALVLLASLMGCVVMIVVGSRYADPPLEATGQTVFKIPLAHPPAAPKPAPPQ